MSTELFRRPARQPPPPQPHGEFVLESPPELPETTSGGNGAQLLMYLPMLGAAGSTAFLTVGGGHGGNPATYVASGMMGLSMVGMAAGGMGRGSGDKRRRLDGDRRDYQRYLEQVRRRVRNVAEQQRKSEEWHHPDPGALWCVAAGTRLWERRPVDADYLAVRIGRGPQRLAVRLVTPETKPVEDLEPISASALRRFVRTYSSVPELPVAISLPAFGRLSVDGRGSKGRAMARAMVGQLAAFHSPDDVLIAVCAAPDRMREWDWLKWLPHSLSPDSFDAVGQTRLVSDNLLDIEATLGATLTNRPRFGIGAGEDGGPHVVVVVDGGRTPNEAQLASALVAGVTVVDVGAQLPGVFDSGALRLSINDAGLSMIERDRTRTDVVRNLGVADSLSVPEAEVLARQMTSLRMSAATAEPDDALTTDLTLPDLLRLGDPYQIDTNLTWRPRAPRDRLRVPIGVGATGQPVDLDIKEAAQGGMGPHGLVIGATGSGKSELLRTLVLGLAINHSSENLNFVLVDFKGGATFASLDVLPHTSAVITNLEDELVLVDRMRDAIAGEMVRRQELLRDAGNYASLKDYEKAREQGAPLEPLPSLFIVVDEFSELLSAKPDFIDLFVMIGRLGRSLGVHLLLASQRLEEGRLRGLDTHLSYRVGLRTFSAMESRVVLGVPDAYELPSGPGNGYLKEGTEALVRFKAAYVSGAYTKSAAASTGGGPSTGLPVLPYQLNRVAEPERSEIERAAAPEPEPAAATGPDVSLMDIIVDRLKGRGTPARKVWLPPLDVPPSIDQLLPALVESDRGLRPADWDRAEPLSTPDRVDRPSLRPAPRPALVAAGQFALRRGRSSAVRQEHRVAQPDRVHGSHQHPRAGAVLLHGLRRRHAHRPGRSAARRFGGDPAGGGATAPDRGRDQRHAGRARGDVHRQPDRLDDDVPPDDRPGPDQG